MNSHVHALPSRPLKEPRGLHPHTFMQDMNVPPGSLHMAGGGGWGPLQGASATLHTVEPHMPAPHTSGHGTLPRGMLQASLDLKPNEFTEAMLGCSDVLLRELFEAYALPFAATDAEGIASAPGEPQLALDALGLTALALVHGPPLLRSNQDTWRRFMTAGGAFHLPQAVTSPPPGLVTTFPRGTKRRQVPASALQVGAALRAAMQTAAGPPMGGKVVKDSFPHCPPPAPASVMSNVEDVAGGPSPIVRTSSTWSAHCPTRDPTVPSKSPDIPRKRVSPTAVAAVRRMAAKALPHVLAPECAEQRMTWQAFRQAFEVCSVCTRARIVSLPSAGVLATCITRTKPVHFEGRSVHSCDDNQWKYCFGFSHTCNPKCRQGSRRHPPCPKYFTRSNWAKHAKAFKKQGSVEELPLGGTKRPRAVSSATSCCEEAFAP